MGKKVELLYGYFIKPHMGYRRVRICYIKNGKEQHAIFMNYGNIGKKDYKLIEDNHCARNGLRANEQEEIAYILNNNLMRLYGES